MVKIRKLQKKDLEIRVAWMNRPEVYQSMHFTPPITIEKTLWWFEKNKSQNRVDMAFEEDDGRLVAMGGLTFIDQMVKKAEFYVFVNPDMQRCGYGTKATFLLCKYGFEVLHLHKIYLYTNESNLGAQKTYEKVGFTLEGRMRDDRIVGDKFEDCLYYGLLADEFDNKQKLNSLTGGTIS